MGYTARASNARSIPTFRRRRPREPIASSLAGRQRIRIAWGEGSGRIGVLTLGQLRELLQRWQLPALVSAHVGKRSRAGGTHDLASPDALGLMRTPGCAGKAQGSTTKQTGRSASSTSSASCNKSVGGGVNSRYASVVLARKPVFKESTAALTPAGKRGWRYGTGSRHQARETRGVGGHWAGAFAATTEDATRGCGCGPCSGSSSGRR